MGRAISRFPAARSARCRAVPLVLRCAPLAKPRDQRHEQAMAPLLIALIPSRVPGIGKPQLQTSDGQP